MKSTHQTLLALSVFCVLAASLAGCGVQITGVALDLPDSLEKGAVITAEPEYIFDGATPESAALAKKLDALGIQYKMVMVDNDGTMAAGCVASTDYKAGTKINTENVTVIVSIAGERDDTLVAQTGNAGESTPEPTPQPEE